jgi:hypothetical protein
MMLGIDPRRLGEIDRRIVRMIGYGLHRPFIGYVDGLHPRKAAERMVDWLQKPMESDPPTFADWPDDGESHDGERKARSNL